MRLIYLSTDPGVPFGGAKGASVHLAELAAALADEGAEVLALVAGFAPDAPSPPPGVQVELVPACGKGASARERVRADGERARWLEHRLDAFRPDALLERQALHSAAGAAAAEARCIPYFVELNSPLPGEAARYRRLDEPKAAEELERRTLERADVVFAVSRPLAEHAQSRGARTVEVLPNGVAIERFPVRRRPLGPPVAVFSGALRPWHGIECIAEAWRLVGAAAPPLLVVGDGPERALLESVGARVTGWLPHDRVPALLASAHIGLAPYDSDAPVYFSPLKVFEYLAARLAVIAGDLPGVTDVVDAESAVVIPMGDAAALAQAVAYLAVDGAERERLGQAGRALVAPEHTWQRRAGRIIEAVAERTRVGVAT